MKPTCHLLHMLPATCLLWACSAPKAILVEEISTPAPLAAAPPAAAPVRASEPDDQLRLPDYTMMPGDSDLKRGPVARPPTDVPPPVIARPPLEPPARSGAAGNADKPE